MNRCTKKASTHALPPFTDSRVTLDSLHNVNDHAYLVEEIRKRVASLERSEWKITFSWVKAHLGIYGNKLAEETA